jgi:hypothetical protein
MRGTAHLIINQRGDVPAMKSLISICLLFFFGSILIAQTTSPPAKPIQVMVLGTYHFGNPGHDLHNLKVDSVLTPPKQAELADVSLRLAKFKPTKIAVEAIPDRENFAVAKFDEFTPATLNTNPDERVQIAFRLARLVGLKNVYGIDEQSDTIDYFPYDKVEAFAKAHDCEPVLAGLHGKVEEKIQEMGASQRVRPVRAMLADLNEPTAIQSDHDDFYYALLPFGNEKQQPGAELNAAWFQRNAKIFAKLAQIAGPGDRVLVVFGSGHAFWLRHFVQNTPGFELIEPNAYLR